MEQEQDIIKMMKNYPGLDIANAVESYRLVVGMCKYLNSVNRPDLWMEWLKLNLKEGEE